MYDKISMIAMSSQAYLFAQPQATARSDYRVISHHMIITFKIVVLSPAANENISR
jgi:hypothetical protein